MIKKHSRLKTPVELKTKPKSKPSDSTSGLVRFAAKGLNEVLVRCNAIGVHHSYSGQNELKLIAFAGPTSTVKAAKAMLQSKQAAIIKCEQIPGWDEYYEAVKPRETKWTVFQTQLGDPRYRLWHALAYRADDPRLMLDCSEESLWSVLRSDRYTTPLLKEWAGWIRGQMLASRLLVPLTSWGCNPGLLTASDKSLDTLVIHGMKTGELSFTSSPEKVSA